MNIQFSTSDKRTALNYLKTAFSTTEINEESAKPILELVSAGKIRIGDPMMYGKNIPIFPDDNYVEDDKVIIMEWINKISK